MDIFDTKGIKPMLISEQLDPYDDPDSIFELKLDGIRCIAYCNDSTDLRNKRDMKLLPRFPELKGIHNNCKTK
ncbi:MAG TPA: DNA ligase, partial [Lachnospiraceae bacterium]|nr:DNA ligase [Lachnospiraceae bacterium]